MINVGILNMVGNFDKTKGLGTQRTSYELWRNVVPHASKEGINVEKVELGLNGSSALRKVSFTLFMQFYNFSKYDIVHLLIPIMQRPRAGKYTKILTTVNEFVLLEKGTVPYQKLIGDVLEQKPLALSMGNFVVKAIQKQIFSSDYISVNSTQTKEEAIKLGFPKDRIFIVNHGVDERFLSKAKYKRNKKFRVGFMGALNVRKNMLFAVDAFKRIGGNDIEFEIWGNPVLEYDNLVSQAKDDKRIKFMGFAPEEKIVQIYDRFDAFVFPSLYEGFGLPILEAHARGLPVILYKDAKIPKEVRKYCFEAKDEAHMTEILEYLKDEGYDSTLRKRATEYARGFTREKEALDTLKVYKQIYSRSHPSR